MDTCRVDGFNQSHGYKSNNSGYCYGANEVGDTSHNSQRANQEVDAARQY